MGDRRALTRRWFVLLLLLGCKQEKPAPVVQSQDELDRFKRRVEVDAAVGMPLPEKPVEPVPPTPPPVAAGSGSGIAIAPRDIGDALALFVDDARTYVAKLDPEVRAYKIVASYVRADGTLDPKYGELVVTFGVPLHSDVVVDDPSRPTGAPVEEVTAPKPRKPGTECPQLVYKAAGGAWSKPRYFCDNRERIVGPRCSPKVVWDRAIAKGAPKDALAILEIQGADARYNLPQQWRFRITDRLRKIDVRHVIADDCATPVEQ